MDQEKNTLDIESLFFFVYKSNLLKFLAENILFLAKINTHRDRVLL